jgi:predicted GTPase
MSENQKHIDGKSIFKALIRGAFGNNAVTTKKPSIPKLVIGINQVDNLADKDAPWISEINLPSPELEKKIKARVEDIKNKLSSGNHSASKEQIEYFSALRAYRLPAVINKIVNNCNVITTSFNPKDITDPLVAPEMSERTRKILDAKMKLDREKFQKHGIDVFISKLMSQLEPDEARKLAKALKDQKSKPIKVAVLGQSGVGKSSTVNNLFGATFKVSRTCEGTTEDNFIGYKDYELHDGSIITVADLPGYGREVNTDKKYMELYLQTLKDVDIILLIIQANDKAIVDDINMVECLYSWSKEGLI